MRIIELQRRVAPITWQTSFRWNPDRRKTHWQSRHPPVSCHRSQPRHYHLRYKASTHNLDQFAIFYSKIKIQPITVFDQRSNPAFWFEFSSALTKTRGSQSRWSTRINCNIVIWLQHHYISASRVWRGKTIHCRRVMTIYNIYRTVVLHVSTS